MRIALLTDQHANRQALDACLAHAGHLGADRYAFTGDLVGYGGDPGPVLDTVMDYAARGAIVVKGNHDEATVRGPRPGMHAEAREAIAWTQGQLSAGQLDFLDTLPLTAERDGMLFVHASAHQPQDWEYVTSVVEAERSLRATQCRMVFSGHVHAPSLYRRMDDGGMGEHAPRAGAIVRIAPQHQYLVIPGSVGQPRDGNTAACYALYDDVSRQLTYYRVPYDHGAAARRVISAGLPIVFAMRLVEGI